MQVNEVPHFIKARLLSVRCYGVDNMMIEAQVVEGCEISDQLTKIFTNNEVSYVQVHNARQGCFMVSAYIPGEIVSGLAQLNNEDIIFEGAMTIFKQ